jgi:ribosomal protein L11 methyltransferase
MSWIEVRAKFSPYPVDPSPIVEIFRTHGIENTLEEGEEISGAIVQVGTTASVVDALRADLLQAGAVSVETRDLVEVNWDEVWKQHFTPRRIGERFVVRPTWEEFDASPDDLIIVLDPGQAFGTGDHATTRHCLSRLESVDLVGKRVLDMGCGSGILGIGAKMLGAADVLAVDIDPIAVDVTKENAQLNNVEIRAEVGGTLPSGPWDVVISNIISATLIKFAADISKEITPGGHWIASGIIEANWPDVREAAERAGFTLVTASVDSEWVGAHFVFQ